MGLFLTAAAVVGAQPAPAQPVAPPAGKTASTAPATTADPKLGTLDAATRRLLATQIALDRAGFSSGEIDARRGSNTDRAVRAFQEAQKLPVTGEVDAATVTALGEVFANPLTTYSITAADVAGPFVERMPADMMKKADLPALGYTSVRELIAERFHVSPALLTRLNAKATFNEGDTITVPNVEPFVMATANAPKPAAASAGRGANVLASPAPGAKPTGTAPTAPAPAAKKAEIVITVTDATKTLSVQDATGATIFHAPVTVGSSNDPLPVGEWKVNGVQRNPVFNYNPALFWDANPTHSKAKLAAGPNNPVGIAWIDLSKEHYGIHGTPEPSRVGHTESHGCIRLTNWDVARLAALVSPGTKVILR